MGKYFNIKTVSLIQKTYKITNVSQCKCFKLTLLHLGFHNSVFLHKERSRKNYIQSKLIMPFFTMLKEHMTRGTVFI